jgi:hypothetical protein
MLEMLMHDGSKTHLTFTTIGAVSGELAGSIITHSCNSHSSSHSFSHNNTISLSFSLSPQNPHFFRPGTPSPALNLAHKTSVTAWLEAHGPCATSRTVTRHTRPPVRTQSRISTLENCARLRNTLFSTFLQHGSASITLQHGHTKHPSW